ncbi:MAG: hypothetical protein F4Z28_16255 [Gammaproteobacteria bacterium]|nr:hypothetical protein [Gammaproteobacteria bacterium]
MDSAEPDPPAAVFDAAQMLGYLAEVDELLVRAGAPHVLHLYVAGGAVIAAKTASRLTGDVDVVSEGMTPQLRTAVQEVSRRHRGLRSDWLNDGAKPQAGQRCVGARADLHRASPRRGLRR